MDSQEFGSLSCGAEERSKTKEIVVWNAICMEMEIQFTFKCYIQPLSHVVFVSTVSQSY